VDPSIFDPQTILDIIDLFAINLAGHFADELNLLHPDILREHFSTKDLDKQGASLQKHIIKDYKRHLYTALRSFISRRRFLSFYFPLTSFLRLILPFLSPSTYAQPFSSSALLPEGNGPSSPLSFDASSSLSSSEGDTRRAGSVSRLSSLYLSLILLSRRTELILFAFFFSLWRRADGKWPSQLQVFGSGGSKPPSKSIKTLPDVPEGREIAIGRERTQSSAQDSQDLDGGRGAANVGRKRSILSSSG